MENKDEKLGTVVFGEALGAKTFKDVVDAANQAGIDEKYVRKLKPKFVFIRAMRELQRRGIIEEGSHGVLRDKTVDDADTVSFQFSRRFVESQGARYDKACVVNYNKNNLAITCQDDSIRQLAEKLFLIEADLVKSVDINQMVRRFLESSCRRIMLRAGVYFIPLKAQEALEQIKVFYKTLGFVFHLYPVGYSGDDQENIINAIVTDIKKNMASLEKEVQQLKVGEGGFTKRQAKTRMRQVQKDLRHYRDLAQSVNTSLNNLIDKSEKAGQTLVQIGSTGEELVNMIRSGQQVSALAIDLYETETEIKLNVPPAQIVPFSPAHLDAEPLDVPMMEENNHVQVGS